MNRPRSFTSTEYGTLSMPGTFSGYGWSSLVQSSTYVRPSSASSAGVWNVSVSPGPIQPRGRWPVAFSMVSTTPVREARSSSTVMSAVDQPPDGHPGPIVAPAVVQRVRYQRRRTVEDARRGAVDAEVFDVQADVEGDAGAVRPVDRVTVD